MADPTKGKIIGIKATNGGVGDSVTIKNLSRIAPMMTVKFTNNEAVFNTANSAANWQTGDKVLWTISGKIRATGTITLTGAGGTATSSASADTSTPAVDL